MDENEFDNQRENKAVARVIISFLKYEEYALKEIYNLRVKNGNRSQIVKKTWYQTIQNI